MNDKQLEKLAQQIRALWVNEQRNFELRTIGHASGWGSEHMKNWDGGTSYAGRTYTPVWPKIAAFCTDNDLDPEVLIRAIFYQRVNYAPKPTEGYGEKALERYRNYVAPGTVLEIKTSLLHQFDTQKQRALSSVFSKQQYSKMDARTAWRITLVSADVPLTPLFRYCVAKNQSWDDIAAEYYNNALVQYRRFYTLYDEVWSDWLPAEIKDAVGKEKGRHNVVTGTTNTQT